MVKDILIYSSFHSQNYSDNFSLYLKRRFPSINISLVTFRKSVELKYSCHNDKRLYNHVFTESEAIDNAVKNDYAYNINELKAREIKYCEVNFGKYLIHDRRTGMSISGWLYENKHKYTYNQSNALLLEKFKYVETLLDKINPDILIYTQPDTGPSLAFVLHTVAKKRNIEIHVPHRARVGNYIFLSKEIKNAFPTIGPNNTSEKSLNEIFDRLQKLEGVYSDPNVPINNKHIYRKHYIARLWNWFSDSNRQQLRLDPLHTSFGHRRLDDIKAKIRKVRYKSVNFLDVRNLIYKKEKFYYFPLHVTPEVSTALFAPFFTNQINLIKNLSSSIPIDCKLVVKEHPAVLNKGLRKLSFYQKIQNINNVLLVKDLPNELIKSCIGVFTITGTPALEAYFYGKPSLVFGDVFFGEFSPGIKKCNNYDDVYSYAQEMQLYKPDLKQMKNNLRRLLSKSFDCSLDHLLSYFRNGGKPNEYTDSQFEIFTNNIFKFQ